MCCSLQPYTLPGCARPTAGGGCHHMKCRSGVGIWTISLLAGKVPADINQRVNTALSRAAITRYLARPESARRNLALCFRNLFGMER